MLTRNYDSLMTGLLTILPAKTLTPTETHWLGGKPGIFKDHFGLFKMIPDMPKFYYTIFGNSNGIDAFSQLNSIGDITPILLVGSNNAEESYDDYALSIISSLTVAGSRYSSINHTSNDCIYNTVKTFVNNTENDITVNEVGLYQHFSENYDVLMYRKKLAQPVVLKARGGTASFNLVIDIPYANKS